MTATTVTSRDQLGEEKARVVILAGEKKCMLVSGAGFLLATFLGCGVVLSEPGWKGKQKQHMASQAGSWSPRARRQLGIFPLGQHSFYPFACVSLGPDLAFSSLLFDFFYFNLCVCVCMMICVLCVCAVCVLCVWCV